MSIILNENEWAESMIKESSLGKKPFETLNCVAKYYISKDYNKKEVRNLLDVFMVHCDPNVSLPKWSDTIDRALTKAYKSELINIESIHITDKEMKTIEGLSGKQMQRLAFTLLCLAKYWNVVNPNSNYWVNNKDSEIMKMANINTSIKRQSMLYHELNKLNLIQFSRKVDNTNVRVCFVEDGKTVLDITDFRNLGYQYLKYKGEPYFKCECCGIVTKIKEPGVGRNPKYCKDCATKIQAQQKINSVMRSRSYS